MLIDCTSKGGRGMISIEECVNVTVHMLNVYITGSQERMLKAVNKENVLKEAERDKDKTGYLKEHAKTNLEKSPHGQFIRSTDQIRDHFLMVAQDQTIRTNSIKKRID